MNSDGMVIFLEKQWTGLFFSIVNLMLECLLLGYL